MADATSMPPETNSQHPDIIVRLQGAGGAELLHGQTTADFKNPGAGDVRYAAFCDPKGRVLADVSISLSPCCRREALTRRL